MSITERWTIRSHAWTLSDGSCGRVRHVVDGPLTDEPEPIDVVRADLYAEAVDAERERIVEALREQAKCYPKDSHFAHVGHGYLNAAEFIEALDRAGRQ